MVTLDGAGDGAGAGSVGTTWGRKLGMLLLVRVMVGTAGNVGGSVETVRSCETVVACDLMS